MNEFLTNTTMIYWLIPLGFFFLIFLNKAIYIVPQKQAFIVQRLGKFHRTLYAGLNLTIPMVDKIAYRHSLKERAIDVPVQVCITNDNIAVEVDAILYLQVMDPGKASYGISDYLFATTQLAQTTIRSVLGKLDLDQTFRERDNINSLIVEAVDKASDPWGIKVNRYEIKDIKPPKSINDAMEKQMRAEREKRATIATSEGEKQARINRASGEKQELIQKSEGEKQKRINESEGKALEIQNISKATANGLMLIAKATQQKGGKDAVSLRIAEQYVKEFGRLAKESNTMIIPANLSDLSGMVATASRLFNNEKKKDLGAYLKTK